LLILLVLTANSSGIARLLIVIGYVQSSANGIRGCFGRYLVEIAAGGLLVLAAILPTLPWLISQESGGPAFPHTALSGRSCPSPTWCCC